MLYELPLPITVADIERWVLEKEPESKILEYKREQDIATREGKKEVCKDVSAFANAAGGLILYGIEEERREADHTTVPKCICGLSETDCKQMRESFQNVLLTGIEPRLTPPVDIQAHDVNGKKVIAVRVYKSWSSPHMIRAEDSRFWQRVSGQRIPLDANAIGAAFLATSERTTRIERFRDDRLGKILSNEGPRPLMDAPKAVLHVLPLTVAEKPPVLLGVDLLVETVNVFPKLFARRNFDGVVYCDSDDDTCRRYVQVFRTGAIEAVTTRITGTRDYPSFLVLDFEDWTLASLRQSVALLRSCGIQPPVLVFVALLRCKGFYVTTNRGVVGDSEKLDLDVLLLPESRLDDFNENATQVLKTPFDIVWEAANCKGSQSYSPDGEFLRESSSTV